MLKRTLVVLTSLFLGASLAHAQPGEPGPPPEGPPAPPPEGPPAPPAMAPMPPPPPSAAPESTVPKGVLEDANSGRGWLMPTALTDPAGTWSFSDFELFLLSAGYAVSDDLSISATTLVPVASDVPFWGLLSAKLQVLHSGNLHVALQGAVTYLGGTTSTSGTSSTRSFTAGDLGGALTLCIDDKCRSTLSGFLGAGFADSSQTAVPFVVAGSFAARLGRHVKFVGELDSAFIAGKINDTANGALLWYGLRFTSTSVGVDVGFMKPVGGVSSDGTFPIGFPIVSLTYRAID